MFDIPFQVFNFKKNKSFGKKYKCLTIPQNEFLIFFMLRISYQKYLNEN